jgi:NADPH:quinone reductase-like Zn-dependent oxidoreductase
MSPQRAAGDTTMRTVIQYEYGGPEVLQVVEAKRPRPSAGQVLVRVKAASVNAGDTKLRAGKAPEVAPLPLVLGSDLSGTVAEVAPDVTTFRPGDDVYGTHFIGTNADYVAVSEVSLATKPPSVDHVQAAALPLAALTAWQAVVDTAHARPDQRILVHAAAGGVGHLAVQLAKLYGAHVIATARAAKHEFVRGLGADEVIDYTAVDFSIAARDVDTVVDLVGGDYGRRSLASLRPGGLLIGTALDPGVTRADADAAGRGYTWLAVRPSREGLEPIADLVQTGRLQVHVERTFPLDAVADAHRMSDGGHVTGKLVIAL